MFFLTFMLLIIHIFPLFVKKPFNAVTYNKFNSFIGNEIDIDLNEWYIIE